MKKYLPLLFIIAALFVFFGCDDSDDDSASENGMVNTLGEGSVGNGETGNVADYFPYLSDQVQIDAKYWRYSALTIVYPRLFDPDADTLNFSTFPEYVVTGGPGYSFGDHFRKITPDDDPASYLTPTLIESYNEAVEDSILVNSTAFRHVDSLVWNEADEVLRDLQYYTVVKSAYDRQEINIAHADDWERHVYEAVLGEMVEEGLVIVDLNEWDEETITMVSDTPDTFLVEFFFDRRIMTSDSLIYRQNCDCNDNGIWDDAAEEILGDFNENGIYDEGEFTDTGNGIWDDDEPFVDSPSEGIQGEWDAFEAFQDRNCNDIWDAAEVYTDVNDNGSYDYGEPFTDRGNGIYDEPECYTDINFDGTITEDEIFHFENIANNLLVSYENGDPVILENVQPGEGMVSRFGHVYGDIIETVTFIDSITLSVDNVDSVITTFTNHIVNEMEDAGALEEYSIAKVQFNFLDAGSGQDVHVYDYHLFNRNESDHIGELAYPSYIFPDGFYGEVPGHLDWGGELADGFWYEENPVEAILYYTRDGLLRDGERFSTDTLAVTDHGVYYVENYYAVDKDTISIPYGDNISRPDCFRITRETRMSLRGSAIEFGQRSTTWLVRDLGIARENVDIRWTEPAWMQDEDWAEYSKVELIDFRSQDLGRRLPLFGSSRAVDLDEFDEIGDFNYDPYQKRRTAGLTRVQLPVND